MERENALSPDWPSWTWDETEERLSIDVSTRPDLSELQGEWTLEALRHLVDGLSASRMSLAFLSHDRSGVGEVINCAVATASGHRVQFVGGYTGDTVAQGIILMDSLPPIKVETDSGAGEPGSVLEPHFQPIFDAKTGQIVGFEALARWQGGRAIDTKSFEAEGLLSGMLIHSAEFAAKIQQDGGIQAFVSVNLSALDLIDPELPALIETVISSHRLTPGTLVAELTEHDALRDAGVARHRAQALYDAGASLMLDDFGAGHSSFLWFVDLPITGVKLDGDLIAKRTEPKGEAAIKALIGLAQDIGISTTAEGVEAGGEAQILANLGIDRIQGFALGRPVHADEALKIARR